MIRVVDDLGRRWAPGIKLLPEVQCVFMNTPRTRGVTEAVLVIAVSVGTLVLEAVYVVVSMGLTVGTNARPAVGVLIRWVVVRLEAVGVFVTVPDTLTDHMDGVISRVFRRFIMYLEGNVVTVSCCCRGGNVERSDDDKTKSGRCSMYHIG
jgi:hypothetical protein